MQLQKDLFGPIKTERTFEQISSKIKKRIFEGALKPGDRLPSEIELAQQFNVSRQTVREALRILELSGFISVQRGTPGGALIKDTILNTINDLFLDAYLMEKITLEELTVARIDIEKILMHHVIENADASDIQLLERNIEAAKQQIALNRPATEENIQYHYLLAKASKNHLFVMVVGSILAVVQGLFSRIPPESKFITNATATPEQILKTEKTIRFHEEILSAIVQKDEDKAIRQLEAHLLEVAQRLQSLMIS